MQLEFLFSFSLSIDSKTIAEFKNIGKAVY